MKKLTKLRAFLQSISACERAPARILASIIGQVISMTLAMGPVSRVRTRALYSVLNTRKSWADKLHLSREAREELQFWLASVGILTETQYGSAQVLPDLCIQTLVAVGTVGTWWSL